MDVRPHSASQQLAPLEPLFFMPAQVRDKQLAQVTVGISLAIFFLVAPFAKVPLARFEAFIPAYQSALVLTDLATAALLFGQWSSSRSRALAILAAGYVFTAVVTVAHTLTFPGLFPTQQLLGAGAQTTAWIYMFWHLTFPLFVIGYVYTVQLSIQAKATAMLAAGAVALAIAFTALATRGAAVLPAIMSGNGYTPAYGPVVTLVWLSSLVALFLLWKKPHRTVLDVWLMVVMLVWACDIALAALLNAGRFDVGFYAGRLYGLLAASFVLWVLLFESMSLYARITLASQAQVKAQLANRNKDEFIAMLGHELRNPTNAVVAAAHVLAHSDDPKVTEPARQIILRQGLHLGRLTDDLLDVGRAVLGKITLDRKSINLASIVQNQLDVLAQTGRLLHHRVVRKVEPVWISGDATRLNQVVGNLLANALKYTPVGGTITVSLGQEDTDAVLRISDTGTGMEPELVATAFDLFVQGPVPPDRARGGLGIGLTLVRRIVELHGGTTEAKSDGKDKGSEFSLRLPVVAPAAEEASPAKPRENGRYSIVVVEDNDDARWILRELLELDGHVVHEARDGPSGVQKILEVEPDIAIIDIGLPRLDGWGVARLVRSQVKGPIRLVALTGYGNRESANSDEFDVYLIKPLDPVKLTRLLATETEGTAVRRVTASA